MAQQNTKIEGMSLDNPHVDKAINAGTTAANCQPRHTRDAMSVDDSSLSDSSTTGEGSSTSSRRLSRSERNVVKRERKAASAKKKKDAEDPKKMGYVQMAKMGYQELVNAIIRPPRAEYKVSYRSHLYITLHAFTFYLMHLCLR